MGPDTRTYWLTDRRSQRDFHFDIVWRELGVDEALSEPAQEISRGIFGAI
jgi:hypothetical protein